MPTFAQIGLLQPPDRADLLPDHAARSRTSGRCSAPPTCRPSSGSASSSPSRPTSGASARGTTRGSCRRWPRTSARGSRTSSSTSSRTAARCGSDDAPSASSSPACRPTGAAGSRRRSRRDPDVEAIIGVSPDDPSCPLERTEYVRVGLQHSLLRRIVQAAEIDTVIDTRLVVDSLHGVAARVAHEINVIGTMNILAACGGPDSPVRKVVVKSSAHYYGCERDDPAYFTEVDAAPAPAAHAAGERHRRGREGRRGLRRAQPGRRR